MFLQKKKKKMIKEIEKSNGTSPLPKVVLEMHGLAAMKTPKRSNFLNYITNSTPLPTPRLLFKFLHQKQKLVP